MCQPANGRKTPYTERGIRQMCCIRCEQQAKYQWNICSLDNLWFPICVSCDIELNREVLKFMGVPARERRLLMERYKETVHGQ
jgi:hypothetical protein